MTADDSGPAKAIRRRSRRVDAVDVARGVAILGMVVYHFVWDLANFGVAPPSTPFLPPMRLLSHVVACTFLALVGVSLGLAHRDRLNLPLFCKRLALVGGAAALVTAASFAFAPGQPVWFGILHCIFAASLLALPFIAAPASASLLAGAAAIALPFVFSSPVFNPPALLWLGLGEALPNTVDWYPLLPWAGVVLLGLGAARIPAAVSWLTSPERWRAKSIVARAGRLAGRHSLVVYLTHQFILFPLVWTAVALRVLSPQPLDRPAFLNACQRSCVEAGRASDECDASCRCVADAIERSGEASADAERDTQFKRFVDACMAR